MRAFLMFADRDFDLRAPEPPNAEDLVADLGLTTLFDAMSLGDELLAEVARCAVLNGLTNPEDIRYRQHILEDCLSHPGTVRRIYELAGAAIAGERKIYHNFRRSPEVVLRRSVDVLELFLPHLAELRRIADTDGPQYRSAGLTTFFRMLAGELDDAFFQAVHHHARALKFRHGLLVSARFGAGVQGVGYVLRRPNEDGDNFLRRFLRRERSALTYRIPERDEAGARALGELRDRGLNQVANALAQAIEHMLSFFRRLRTELGFYLGCLNLHERLTGKGEPTCVPEPLTGDTPVLDCRGLYDLALSLSMQERTVGNDVTADGVALVVVTGANRGGKSTFLRSVGQAQLMMQCGMSVSATMFRTTVSSGLFTHYRREEDTTMSSGKLDEELARMSTIVDDIGPTDVLLCNESFASTNEREGSEIARQIVRALLDVGVRVLFVTHMYDLAEGWYRDERDVALFLRAERDADARRSFRLTDGEPLPTSYGEDLYHRIFEPARAAPSP